MRLLLVEDDLMVGTSACKALLLEGFIVDWVRDAEKAALALDAVSYSLLLLDLGLPRKDGLTLLRECRKKDNPTPTIIITAREDVDNRVAGLNCGADDYLVKPVDLRELVARIRAVTRRHSGRANPELTRGSLRLNPMTHEVFQNDRPIVLSRREFALLQALLRAQENVLSRSELEEQLYGWGQEVESNTIDVHIHNLRKKLGTKVIRNVRGIGYVVADTN